MNTSGWSESGGGLGSRDGSGFGRSEKPLALGTESPGNRRPRAQGHRADAEGAPQLLRRKRVGGANIEGTGNRVSVNGVERRRSRLAGHRASTPATESGSPGDEVGAAPLPGNRWQGQSATGVG